MPFPHHDADDPYDAAVMAGWEYLKDASDRIGPTHLLVGIADGDTDAGRAIAAGGRLREAVSADPRLRPGSSWLRCQAQDTAEKLAETFGQDRRAEHLLVALLDQGTPGVLEALRRARIGPAAARRAALASLDLPSDLPPVPLETRTAAGTDDRPPLPVDQLDPRAWQVLCWRADHLPLQRLHRPSDWEALSSLEYGAALRAANRYHLDDDQRYSLLIQHWDEIDRIASAARPDVVETRAQRVERFRAEGPPRRSPLHERWIRVAPSFMVGWPSWFGNRRVGLRNKWFRLTTRAAYRGQPG